MIIDSHAHMITEDIARNMKIDPKRFSVISHSVKENTKTWLEAMDRLGIEKTVFMSTVSLNQDFTDFIKSSDRFIGMARVNPTLPDAVNNLKKELENGMKGVKMYPTSDGFDTSSKEAYPFYDFCKKNNLPIVIHFGVTIGRKTDLINGNPLKLSKVLGDYPKINFIIAHFGAGFFREVLMLKYKKDNLFVDTSGTNNWIPHQDNFFTLKDIFKKTIDVFTPKNIIFGSDTRIFPDGYRENILNQQRGILDELHLKDEDKEDIMYNNAKRVFDL